MGMVSFIKQTGAFCLNIIQVLYEIVHFVLETIKQSIYSLISMNCEELLSLLHFYWKYNLPWKTFGII